jgi:uncharacterized membrane protein YjjP (DUF1212 family)
MMLNPLVVFSFVLSTLIGAGFHLLLGGGARRLALFLLASWVGFAMGQAAGRSIGWEMMTIGDLHIIPAVGGAVITLIVALVFTTERRRAT